MDASIALMAGQHLIDMISAHCQRIEIAGSIRRGKQDPKDVEIVVIPQAGLLAHLDQLLASGIIAKATYGETKTTRWGDKYRGLILDGAKIEIFVADEENWGYIFWLRTGPADANTSVMHAMQNTAWRAIDGNIYHSNNWQKVRGEWDITNATRVPIPDEDTMFKVLGLPFIAPSARFVDVYKPLSRPSHQWGVYPLTASRSLYESRYAMLPLYHAQRDEYERLPPNLPKHRLLEIWIRDKKADIKATEREIMEVRLAYSIANKNGKDTTQLERQGNRLKRTLEEHKMYLSAYVERYKEGVEAGFPTYAGILGINIADNIKLEIDDLLGESVAVLGIKGSGKSNTAAVLIEEMMFAGVPVGIIDIAGEYHGLRELGAFIIGNTPYADLNVSPDRAGDIAKISLQHGKTVVLDISEFNDEDRMTAVHAFLSELWATAGLMRAPYQIVLEEAHNYIPQSAKTPVKELITRIATEGRKRGLGITMISQRSARVCKNVLSQAGIKFFHNVSNAADLSSYLANIPPVAMSSADARLQIFSLQPGESLYIRRDLVQRSRIRLRQTYHAGYTPGIEAVKSSDNFNLDSFKQLIG